MTDMGVLRVIVHFDCDAFYAQCEEVRDPSLKSRPLGVTQKYLIVTSNYPARRLGVAKLMSIKEAQERCPGIVLINGEDLTPYRKASKNVLAVLQRFGVAEKLGMDEVLLDVSQEVESRIKRGSYVMQWAGHLHDSSVGVVQENRHRVMDLRANSMVISPPGLQAMDSLVPEDADPWTLRLMIGSQIASEARAAMKAEVGFRSSAGISSNRMLAKLSSGLHKPDDQTVLHPLQAPDFVAPLPLRAIPGIGSKMDVDLLTGAELREMGLEKVEDLRQQNKSVLTAKFGERIASFLMDACLGRDPTPVKPKLPSKTVTVEDSFKSCTSPQAASHVLQILVPDLLKRLQEEYEDEGRRPRTLTLKWRHKGNGWSRNSASCPLPGSIQVHRGAEAVQSEVLLKCAVALFNRNVQPPFNITLFNLGATNFVEKIPDAGPASGLARFLSIPAQQKSSHEIAQAPSGIHKADQLTVRRRNYGANPLGPAISKTQERLLREAGTLGPIAPDKGSVSLLQMIHGRPDHHIASISQPPASPGSKKDCRDYAASNSREDFTATDRQPLLVSEADEREPSNPTEHPNMTLGQGKEPLERQIAQPVSCVCPQQVHHTSDLGASLQEESYQVHTDPASMTSALAQNESHSGLKGQPALSEICKLRSWLKQPQDENAIDKDLLLARRLQAEELNYDTRTLVKRKHGPLDSYFDRKRVS